MSLLSYGDLLFGSAWRLCSADPCTRNIHSCFTCYMLLWSDLPHRAVFLSQHFFSWIQRMAQEAKTQWVPGEELTTCPVCKPELQMQRVLCSPLLPVQHRSLKTVCTESSSSEPFSACTSHKPFRPFCRIPICRREAARSPNWDDSPFEGRIL